MNKRMQGVFDAISHQLDALESDAAVTYEESSALLTELSNDVADRIQTIEQDEADDREINTDDDEEEEEEDEEEDGEEEDGEEEEEEEEDESEF